VTYQCHIWPSSIGYRNEGVLRPGTASDNMRVWGLRRVADHASCEWLAFSAASRALAQGPALRGEGPPGGEGPRASPDWKKVVTKAKAIISYFSLFAANLHVIRVLDLLAYILHRRVFVIEKRRIFQYRWSNDRPAGRRHCGIIGMPRTGHWRHELTKHNKSTVHTTMCVE